VEDNSKNQQNKIKHISKLLGEIYQMENEYFDKLKNKNG
jgi:hypothetical protein